MGYSELMKDPLEAVNKIYSHFNLKLSTEAAANMKRHLVGNKQNKYGTHKYSMEEFGISADDIERDMKEFIDYFKDSQEILI